jgi:signal transduction histidine kinase
MLGYSRDDLLAGKLDPATLIPPNGRDPAAAADVPVEIDGVRQPCESEYLRKDGSRVPVLVAVAPLEGDESLSLSLDLSERNRANEELRKSREALARTEKLRALGQMAAGVTHDVKNILNPLSLHLQIAQRANVKGSKETVEEAHQGMKQALAHGLEVLERLRNFSRQTPESKLASTACTRSMGRRSQSWRSLANSCRPC